MRFNNTKNFTVTNFQEMQSTDGMHRHAIIRYKNKPMLEFEDLGTGGVAEILLTGTYHKNTFSGSEYREALEKVYNYIYLELFSDVTYEDLPWETDENEEDWLSSLDFVNKMEIVIEELLLQLVAEKEMKKHCKKGICFRTVEQPKGEYYTTKTKFTPENVARLKKKENYQIEEILNLRFETGTPSPATLGQRALDKENIERKALLPADYFVSKKAGILYILENVKSMSHLEIAEYFSTTTKSVASVKSKYFNKS